MPKIPSYERQVSFSGNQQPAMSRGMSQVPEQIAGQAGDALLKLSQKIEQIDKYRQETEAVTRLQSNLNELKVRYNEEPDLEKKKEYWGKIDEVVNGSIEGISDYETRLKFERQAKLIGDSSLFTMKNEYRNQVVRQASDNLELARVQAEEYAKTDDAVGIRVGLVAYDNAINKAKELGIIGEEEASYRMQSANKVVKLNQLYYTADENPEAVISMVEDDDSISLDEKNSVKKYAKSKITERVQIQELERLDAIIKESVVLPKDLNLKTVEAFEANGIWPKDVADKIRTRIMNGIAQEPAESNYISEDKLLAKRAELFDLSKTGKVEQAKGGFWTLGQTFVNHKKACEEYLMDALREYGDGNLTRGKYEQLTRDVMNLANNKGAVEVQSSITAYKTLQSLAAMDNPLTMRRVVTDLYSKLDKDVQGVNPVDASRLAREMFNSYKGLPADTDMQETKETQGTGELRIGANFNGGKIKAVRPK